MIRTRIQLSPDQYERLKALAARRSTSFAQLVREGVDHVLAAERRESAWDRFLSAAGSCRAEDDAPDVSERHDVYLSEVLADLRAESEPEFGFRPFPGRGGVVTNELIDRLREETGD